MTVQEAFQHVVDNQTKPALNYAVNYAQYGLTCEPGGHDELTQALYVLVNMTHWRGPLAKEVRAVLKEATK